MGLECLDIIENIKPDIKKIMIGKNGNSISLLEARLKRQIKLTPQQILDQYFEEFPPEILKDKYTDNYYLLKIVDHGSHDLGFYFAFNSSDDTPICFESHIGAINYLMGIMTKRYSDHLKTLSSGRDIIWLAAFASPEDMINGVKDWIKRNIKKADVENSDLPVMNEARLKKQLKPNESVIDIIWEVLLERYWEVLLERYSEGSYCLDDGRDRDNFLVVVHDHLKRLNRLDLFHFFVEAVADEMSHGVCFDNYYDARLFRYIVINKYNNFLNKN